MSLSRGLELLNGFQVSGVGFLPARAPLRDLPAPYQEISDACHELPLHYHGAEKDCRPWLDGLFGQIREPWMDALKDASVFLQENLMTKVSLLCHAYRWQRMPTPRENYELKEIHLPAGLATLWSELARRLGIPRVGNFYTMVANNWELKGISPGGPYSVDAIGDSSVELVHSWLLPPLHEELRTFVVTALSIEARGAKVLAHIKEVHECIMKDNPQEATYHLTFLAATLLGINSDFNRAIRKTRIQPNHFLTYVQPTMIWLLDHGEGPLEGASGPQACTLQLLDSFLGVPRDNPLGQITLKARDYMMPLHRQLLEAMDLSGQTLRRFVTDSGTIRLLDAYNRCLQMMKAWRTSHQKRGAMYIEGESANPVEHYVSTGLVVRDNKDRVQVFEDMMESHIIATESQALTSEWQGKERSLDYLFRFLPPAQRQILTQKSETARVAAGEVIIAQGDLFPGLFVLESGTASVVKKSAGQERVVDTLRPNEVFGEMSLIENLPASASIVANVELEVRQVSLETVYDLIEGARSTEADFYLALAQLLSQRLRNRPD